MKLYFRACELQESMSFVERFGNLPKAYILKKCYLSLMYGVHPTEDHVFILNDNLQPETMDFLYEHNTCENFEEVPIDKHDRDYCLHNIVLFKTLEENLGTEHDMHLIIEDDYLWTPNALDVIRQMMPMWNPGFIVPQDYPDRYRDRIPCQIMAGPDRPWRTIYSSTWNMGGSTSAWEQWLPKFKEAAPTGNDKILDEIYLHTPCISPLPGLATHMTNGPHMTPYVDWKGVWDLFNI